MDSLDTHQIPIALSFDDVLLVPQHSQINSRSKIDLTTKITPNITLKIPLMSINMDCVTGIEMAIAMGNIGGCGILPRFDTPDIQAQKITKVKEANVPVIAAVGCKAGELDRAEKLVKAGADALTLDIAHGHMQKAINMTKELKNKFGKKVDIISGVVASYDGAVNLFKAGADSVRVGIGPGSICTTRIMTGHGVPQITALLECAKAAKKFGKTIISDGGTKNSGDIVKALAAGASAITAGYQFAGTDEAPGEIIEINGQKYKEYNGSTSTKEKQKQLEKDPNGKNNCYIKHVEGVEGYVLHKGSVYEVLEKILAGIRSGYSYSGAKNINELWSRAEFIRITPAGMRESQAHDVIRIKLPV